MSDLTRRYGLLLPHFGEHASRRNLMDGAIRAEELSFDSLWVRDHLVFHPHGMEGQDRTHVDPMVTLGMIAAVTEKVILGTGSLIPYRHPIQAALVLSSLEYVAGAGRVIAGFGMGTFEHEFVAAGMEGWDRREVMPEQIAIMRKLWTGEEVSYQGKFYSFENVDIHPIPAGGPSGIPIWYCGNSPASVRRAVEYCDGWMPGRITMKTFEKRVKALRQKAAEAGREPLTPSAIPITSPATTREKALSKVNWREMMEQAYRAKWENESGRWETPEDLDGALIAGPPEVIIADTRRYQEAGLAHIVYDLRFRYDDWFECIDIIGKEVLPEMRRLDAQDAAAQPAAAAV